MSCCPNPNIYQPLVRDCNGDIRSMQTGEAALINGSVVGSYEHMTPGGRLTASSTDPLTNASGTTLYYLPYAHDKCSLLNKYGFWQLHQIPSGGLSVVMPSVTDTNFDVFLFFDEVDDTLKLVLEEWTSDTARDISITQVNGIWSHDGNNRKRYLGSVRVGDTSGQVEDANRERFIFNQYNREWRRVLVTAGNLTADNWTYTGSTSVRQLNNDTVAQAEFIVGHASEVLLYLFLHINGSMDAGYAWLGWDNDSANGFGFARMKFSNTADETKVIDMNVLVPLGYHYYAAVEQIDNAANTWSVDGTNGQFQIRGQIRL